MRHSLITLIFLTALNVTYAHAGAQRASIHPGASRSFTPNRADRVLARAVELSDYYWMERALRAGANPDGRHGDAAGSPFLLLALGKGDLSATQLLLSYGADPNGRDSRGTPILISAAALTGNQRQNAKRNRCIERILTDPRVRVDSRDTARVGDDRSALHMAAAAGNLLLVDQLLKSGATVDLPNRYGETALQFAATNGHLPVVKRLIQHGAAVTVKARFTRTSPLMAAAENGQAPVVRYLLSIGADPRARDAFGKDSHQLAQAGLRRMPASRARYWPAGAQVQRYRETLLALRAQP